MSFALEMKKVEKAFVRTVMINERKIQSVKEEVLAKQVKQGEIYMADITEYAPEENTRVQKGIDQF